MKADRTAYLRAYRKANAEKIRAYNASRAETNQAYQTAYRAAHREDLRQYFKDHYRANMEKKRAQSKAYREANREWYLDYLKQYVQEHKEEHRERGRKWLHENRAYRNELARKNRAINPMPARESNRRYHRLHPEQKKVMKAKRRARMAAQPCTVTARDIRQLYERQQGKCYWCKQPYGVRPHLDHVYPVARGGAHSKENVVLACESCNLSKGAKTPFEWAGLLL